MSLKIKATSLLEPAVYGASLANVEKREGINGPFLLWTFGLTVDDVDTTLSMPTSMSFSSGSRARTCAEALLGRPLECGEEIDLDTLVDALCGVRVTVGDLKGVPVNRIEEVLPRIPVSENGGGDVPF